jgi:two-component sensor histidine kinase
MARLLWTAQGYRRLLQQLREAEATRELLNLELVHRNKNILANVQSIVGLALMGQSALRDAISGRISALGATNDLLVRSEWRSASFREILIAEFTPFGLARFRLNGSDVDCPQTLAVLLALVVHELTTNAVKYGALLIDAGRVDVAWTYVCGHFTLEWVESGGPEPTAPAREGFGTKLLRSGSCQFQGAVDVSYERTGFRCRLSLIVPQPVEAEIVDGLAPRLSLLRSEKPLASVESDNSKPTLDAERLGS